MIDLVLRPIALPVEGFAELAAEAKAEGQAFVARLEEEWRSGINRFSGAGEHFLGAFANDHLAGVGGLNEDPYTARPGVARLRHIYVRSLWRSRGVASALTLRLVALARQEHFATVRLRTGNAAPARLYERQGFVRVRSADATHELTMV